MIAAGSLAVLLLFSACAADTAAVGPEPSASSRGLGSGGSIGTGMTSGSGRGSLRDRY